MRVGVIGIGRWGAKVLQEYTQLARDGKIDSVGICDLRKNTLREYPGIKVRSESYKKFLKSKDIDAVHICTGNSLHYQIALEALKAGKHVLLEKPMATSSDQAYDLIEESERSGLILQVGHIYRFSNVIKKVKKLVSEGYFGQIRYVKVKWTHLMLPIPGTDVIWDLLPHPVDILNIITGKWPLYGRSMEGKYTRDSLSEVAFISLRYRDFFMNAELSWLDPTRRRLLEIVGSEKAAYVECVNQVLSVVSNNGSEWEQIPVSANNTIRDEELNFLSSIKSHRSPHNSHIVGARSISVIENIVK